jgi:hypothetical protein
MGHKAYLMLFATVLLVVLSSCAPGTVVLGSTPAPQAQAATPAPGGQINLPGISIQVYAPGPNPLVNTPDAHGRPAGFWLGLWHGIISPITLVASFVTKQNVQIYEVHNEGSLYNLGFFLGILVMPGIFGLLLGRRG